MFQRRLSPRGNNCYLYTTEYRSSVIIDLTALIPTRITHIGFFWGSVDSYNSLLLYGMDGNQIGVVGFTGGVVTGAELLDRLRFTEGSNRFVNLDFNAAERLGYVELRTVNYAFELDNFAIAVEGGSGTLPTARALAVVEPGTATLFAAAGVGLAGVRRRRRTQARARQFGLVSSSRVNG